MIERCFYLPLADIQLTELHSTQQVVAHDPALYRVLAAGRRWGKSKFACSECTYRALVHRFSVWWVVPVYKNAIDSWKELVILANTIPGRKVFKDEMLIEYPGGGTVQVISAQKPDNVRGSGLGFVVLDEAAYIAEVMWTDVISPALMDRDGRALLISTPSGFNWFYQLYALGLHGDPEYKSFHYTSYDNPYLDPAVIDRRKRTMTTKAFEQEIMAEFREDALGVFRGWRNCVYHEREDVLEMGGRWGPLEGHAYSMGVDWGRSHDYTAISVWDVTERREVLIDHFNEVGWDLQRGRIAMIARNWNVSIIYAEENSIGQPNVEALQLEGLPVIPIYMTNAVKGTLVLAFALALEQESVRLLDDEWANNELQTYEQHPLKSGAMRYASPEGGHDDCNISRILGYHALAEQMGEPMVLEW